jgi:hypothetical protein
MKPIIYFSFVIILFIQCKTNENFIASKPEKFPSEPELKIPNSIIPIPIEIDLLEVNKNLNQKFKDVLYADNDFENNGKDNVKVNISKKENLNVYFQADTLNLDLPIKIDLVGRYIPPIQLLSGLSIEKNLELNMLLKGKIKIEPQNNYEIKTKTKLSYSWINDPKLDFGYVKIPIKFLLDQVIKREIEEIEGKIDFELKKQLNFNKIISETIKKLSQPIAIDKENKAILLTTVHSIALAQIHGNKLKLNTTAEFNTTFDLIVDTSSIKASTKKIELPKLQVNANVSPKFQLHVAPKISYNYINNELSKQFSNKDNVFENGKYIAQIKKINLSSLGEEISIQMLLHVKNTKSIFKKNFKGEIYVIGKPIWNNATEKLQFSNVRFDVKSKDLLVKSASWFLKSDIIKQIEAYQVDVKPEIIKAKNQINQAFKQIKLNDNFSISAGVDEIKLIELFPTEKNISIHLESKGKIQGKVTGVF